MKEIKILGGGLSGLVAAINLAKEGYDVNVYEKNEDVGMRFHGDIHCWENWSGNKTFLEELKEMNIDSKVECTPFFKFIVTNCSKTREIKSDQPIFYLGKRGSSPETIDHSLKMEALRSNVKFHFGKTLPPNEVNIVATGPIEDKVTGVVKGILFKTDSNDDVAITVFNDELAFQGYSYFFTTGGSGTICTVVQRDKSKCINSYFEKTKRFFVNKLNLNIQITQEVGGVGSFSMENVTKGSTLYAGEAAGLQDFLWGYGTRYAITSGYLAAQSIINNLDYRKIIETHFGRRLKAGVVNRYLLENVLSKNDYSFIINFAKFPKKLHWLYNYNLVQILLYPIAFSKLRTKYTQLEF